MKRIGLLLACLMPLACGPMGEHQASSLAIQASESMQDRYPSGPEISITPGDLCQKPDEYRYPEQIPYCRRSVSSSLKNSIIRKYDLSFGYSIQKMPRNEFKIDHLIPLCMGGSNDVRNLWPQHQSVYERTDPIEQSLCIQLERAEITQQEAIHHILQVKIGGDYQLQYQ